MLQLCIGSSAGKLSRPNIVVNRWVLGILHPTAQDISDRLQRRKRIHDIDRAALFAEQLNFKMADDHEIILVNNLNKLRVDLGRHRLTLDIHDGRPGLMNRGKNHFQHDVDDARFSGREHSPGRQSFNTAPKTAKEIIQRREHDTRVDHHHRGPAQTAQAHSVDRKRRFEIEEIIRVSHSSDSVGRDSGTGAQYLQETQSQVARKSLGNHVDRSEIDTNRGIFRHQIMWTDRRAGDLRGV